MSGATAAREDIVVFLGPTLEVAQARAIVDATYLPPAAMGSVLRAVSRRPRVIAIVDGVFDREPAVWHKEILFALSQGVHVLGAASMGALRAAELAAFGMVGVGRVFAAFRDGALEDDDEVAVAHARGADGRALSDALVNIREGVRVGLAAGVLGPALAEAILVEQKRRFYPERSWRAVLAGHGLPRSAAAELAALRGLLPTAPDVKRADAAALLAVIRERHLAAETPAFVPEFEFACTADFQRAVLAEMALAAGPGEDAAPCGDVARHVRLTRADRRELLRGALARFLVARAAARHGFTGSELGRGLCLMGSVEELTSSLDALTDTLVEAAGFQLDPFVCAELAARGELTATAAAVQAKWSTLHAAGIDAPDLSHVRVSAQELSDWFERRFGGIVGTAEEHARRLGFGSWPELLREVVAQHLIESGS